MKILHTADLHIGMVNYSKLDPETGLETRLLDFFKTLDFIVDTAIKENVDVFIFAGDAYKTRDPSPTQQRGFGERIKKITKAGIPVIMVVGNHDTPNALGKANTLDIYSALEIDNVWVLRKPELLKVPTKSGNLQVIAAPWLHKNDLSKLGDLLPSLYEKIDTSLPVVLAGHLEVEGSTYGSEKGMAILGEGIVPLSLLTDKRLNYVALGHIHKYQVLSQNPPVLYSGSPERIDFGEEKEDKGVVLISVEDKKTSYQFIPTSCRQFLTVKIALLGSDQNPTQTILDEIGKYDVKDKIVRILIDIPAGLDKNVEVDKIKKSLAPAHFIAGISRNIERKEREKLIQVDGVEKLTPLEALEKYFESKKYNPERIKLLKKYTQELLEDYGGKTDNNRNSKDCSSP